MRTAQVILDIPTRALSDAFTYEVPAPLIPAIDIGCCVRVDFNNRPALGYVLAIVEEPNATLDYARLKPIDQVLTSSLFTQNASELAQWIAHEYISPLSEAIRLFMPPGASPRLSRDEKGEYVLRQPQVHPVDDRWVSLTEEGQSYIPKRTAIRQRAVIETLRSGEMRVAELSLTFSQISSILNVLEKQGVVRIENRRHIRGMAQMPQRTKETVILTDGQSQALTLIMNAVERKDGSVVLIDGVTGSGKTEVYLRAISRVLAKGQSACVLVPEIALTPQTVGRFRGRFGDQVAVLHSRLSSGERYDQWDLIRTGAARVVVGARSALYAPYADLGLIVIDEEHEGSYKQESSPRYHTRDVAHKMAECLGITLVLGSASPSLESLRQCQMGEWHCVELPERACGRPLPAAQVVDLSKELQAGNKTMFSRALQQALRETIEREEKAVILLNKRGFSSFLLCRDCGYVPECDSCSVSLTYHRGAIPVEYDRGLKQAGGSGYLMCHHCGAIREVPTVCPKCGSRYLKQLGPGTEHAAEQLEMILPEGTPIIRMDADTTRNKGAHERLLEEFMTAETGVLLGTQMIAKGLDFPDVTLVGVLIADVTLKLPDFRAPERTFQLLEQVAGRAGRAEKDGHVIIQTYWPEHYAIRAAAAHDRRAFMAAELPIRKELGYPPYARLTNIIIKSEDKKLVRDAAVELGDALRALIDGPRDLFSDSPSAIHDCCEVVSPISSWQVLGPAPCLFSRLRGDYRWHILIKSPCDADISTVIEPIIRSCRMPRGVSVSVDVDPADLF